MSKFNPQNLPPTDAHNRRQAKPVICYPVEHLPIINKDLLDHLRQQLKLQTEITVPPREANTAYIPKGHFFRIYSVEGAQVGDLNIWNADNIDERFYSGKTRQLHASHLSTHDRLWSNHPYLRPLATISYDTLDWYGYDDDGASVHDVIGTRCDPYTNKMLTHNSYHHCCHSNLCRAFANYFDKPISEIEHHIHDVLNVFMCTGFHKQTHQYFMKASPVRPDDYIEFFAECNLLIALSACPGGDCSSEHSSDTALCHPLQINVYQCTSEKLQEWQFPTVNSYQHP